MVSQPAQAQITPPVSVVSWTGAAGDGGWGTAGNWSSGVVPPSGAHVSFGTLGTAQAVDVGSGSKTLSTLWFDSSRDYTLAGGTLNLGAEVDDYLIVVNGPSHRSAININSNLAFAPTFLGSHGRIVNHSGGVLRLGGSFSLGGNNVRVEGDGTTHFAGALSGTGAVEVGDAAGSTAPQLVLSGDNNAWSGVLNIHSGALAIAKAPRALGTGSSKTVFSGGTLALRTHHDGALVTYAATTQPVQVSGHGITRKEGMGPIGAIYGDGGRNRVNFAIQLNGDTSFGARDERALNGTDEMFAFYGQISGNGSFIKVGDGAIALRHSSNTWTGSTILRGGVLWGSVPNSSNLVLDGGIFSVAFNFSRSLGTGANQIRWTGDGGFAAWAANRSITLGAASDVLNWGVTNHFIGNGSVLLLGSRHSNAEVQINNAINLGNQLREVRVVRGANTSRGRFVGKLSGGPAGGILKTGAGFLWLSNTANDYGGPTVIRDGALHISGNFASTTGAASTTNIQLDGGVLSIGGTDFTRSIGTGAGQIQWTSSGGFMVSGAARIIRLNNSTATINWTDFMPTGAALMFGHSDHTSGTILWDKGINLGSGNRTIRLGWDANKDHWGDVRFRQPLSSGSGAVLNIEGNGRVGIEVDNPNLELAELNVRGELILQRGGRLAKAPMIINLKRGLLQIDNGVPSVNYDRIHDDTEINMEASHLRYFGASAGPVVSEQVGNVRLVSGANIISMGTGNVNSWTTFLALELLREAGSRSTLSLDYSRGNLVLDIDALKYAINDAGGRAIIPWMVVNNGGDAWRAFGYPSNGTAGYTILEDSGLEGNQANWGAARNAVISGTTQMLNANRVVNSLVVWNGSNLNLNGRRMTINSGGLMNQGVLNISGGAGSLMTTAQGRPLYIHNLPGNLQFQSQAQLTGGMDLVKTGAGQLIFNGTATHNVGAVYLHQGTVDMRSGRLSVTGNITVGDGAGTDILKLGANQTDPIIKTGGGLPSITLNGDPYDPRGPEYGGAQAILQLGGNTTQRLAKLHIENRGTIDWVGGEMGAPNILYLDELTFSDAGAQLFMRNWREYEDMLLVRKVFNGKVFDTSMLAQVIFEGYQNYVTMWKDYNNDFLQITPFGSAVPEPSTYGALLGVVGLGLYLIRRRRKQTQNATTRGAVA